LEVVVRREAEASALLADPRFRDQWRDLYRNCPWATVFQDVPYVTRWYELYCRQFEPVLALGRNGCDELMGLLCLGVQRVSGKPVIAGVPHSEYTAWIARPKSSDGYIERALDGLADQFPGHRVVFPCLPPGTPLGWLSTGQRWRSLCDLRSLSRPIMSVGDGRKIRESLQKKSNRQHLRQLEKRGCLDFQRIHRFDEIAKDFAEILDLHDFRLCARYGVAPFQADPSKGALLRSLYEVPELLHTTVWRLDGKIISARIGFLDRRRGQVSLGYLAHSPSLARHSPARLHIYLVGLLLAQEGIPELDLTAGGGDYKERFATHHDEVHRLTVFFSRARRMVVAAQAALRCTARKALGSISVTPQDVRRQIDRANSVRQHVMGTLGRIISLAPRERSFIAYHRDHACVMADTPEQSIIRKNTLADLLTYEPAIRHALSKEDFIRDAWARLERGDDVYTCVQDGMLVFHGWVSRTTESGAAGTNGTASSFASRSVLVDELTTHVGDRDRVVFRTALAKIFTDLALSGDQRTVVALVDRADRAACRILVELGFTDRPSAPVVNGRAAFETRN
jgi:CelD/BcsL family acetyltransferase involved in cellulose biosynthesis